MKYKIKIEYSTGDSFHNEDTSGYIEFDWVNLDIAKENLQRIKEHYQMYKDINGYSCSLSREEIFDKNKDKDWFVNTPVLYCISSGCRIDEKDKVKVGEGNWEFRPDIHLAEYCLKLKLDNGNVAQMRAFWCGYFESLSSAEIKMDKSDLKIRF